MSIAKKKRPTDPHSPVTRVLIVDDHPVVRAGFARYLGMEPDMEVCGEASSATEALTVMSRTAPDLALVDIALQEGNGIELIKDIKARNARVRVLVISGHNETDYAERCLHAGAVGYLSKHEAADKVVEAIRRVLRGNIYLSDAMSARLLRRVAGGKAAENASAMDALSDREMEVFELIGQGLTIREVAGHLSLSPKTVETYRGHLKRKLGLSTSSELARRAFEWVLRKH